jgi:hypothetical protein
MDTAWSGFSLQFDQPWLLLCVLPVVGIIVWQIRYNRRRFSVRTTGLEYLTEAGIGVATDCYYYRIGLMALVALLIAIALAGPQIRTREPFRFGMSRELYPVYLVALDVSGSMTEPLGGYVINGQLNTGGITRFEASREKLYDFVGKQAASRFGLVLFSVQPMLVRWPTLQTEFDFRDILDEGMRYTNPDRNRPSQLARFAGGTATRDGLTLAREVLSRQQATGKSLILIGDLIDNTDEIVEGIEPLYEDDVYTHVLAIDPQPENLESLTQALGDRPGIYIHPVRSPEDLATAFAGIESIEAERLAASGNRNHLQELRWFFALAGFIVALITIILYETRLHKTQA